MESMRVSTPDSEYFRALRVRFCSAVNLAFWYDVSIGDWTPRPTQCHDNVDRYADHDPRFERVRGWLIAGAFAIPHSVLRDTASGQLLDITPPDAIETPPPQPWPDRQFVLHQGTPQQFREIAARYPGYFDYNLLF